MDAAEGLKKIAWAEAHMPLLARIRDRFAVGRPLGGHRVGVALHLEAKTAALIRTLREGGAELFVVGSNPLSTQDDVAGALDGMEGIQVRARRGESLEAHHANVDWLLDNSLTLIVEDGGDVSVRLVERGSHTAPELIGICEETTTGVERLQELEADGLLRVPAFAVNKARMKHLIDNRYGTGQSTWGAIMGATNLLVAGKNVLIVGYGWCGRGLALRAAGLGARVFVCESDPVKAVEAAMEGYRVVTLVEGMRLADFVVTATGRPGVVGEEALAAAKDGAVLANAGHFGYEYDNAALAAMASGPTEVRAGVEAYALPGERSVYLLARGELVNLAWGDGHPVEIMDISFALQAMAAEYLVVHQQELPMGVHPVPDALDDAAARLVLEHLRSE